MGNKSPKTIGDCAAMGLDLLIACQACGREAVFDPAEVMMHWTAHGRSLGLPIDTSPFRCRCGERGGTASPLMRFHRPDPLPSRALILRPIYFRRR